MRTTLVLLLLFTLVLSVHAEEATQVKPPDATPTAPIPLPVIEADAMAWEQYELMRQLSETQIENVRLQNAAVMNKAYANLNDRFRRRYNLDLMQIEKRGTLFFPKAMTTGDSKPPASP